MFSLEEALGELEVVEGRLPYLATLGYSLSDAQAEAVTASLDKSVVVLAGPGAGKTKVLTERVGYLAYEGVNPEDILVCTFTREAAQEMQKRLRAKNLQIPYVGTMHSLSLKLCAGNLLKEFRLVGEEECEDICAALAKDFDILQGLDGGECVGLMNKFRENDYVPDAFFEVYHQYRKEIDSRGVDFLGLIETLLKEDSPKKFRYLLVDEAQDLTAIQQAWLAHISATGNYFLVGDDDQSIYSFRGYQGGILDNYIKSSKAKVVNLNMNYRCKKGIVDKSLNLISHNQKRWPKELVAFDSADKGEVVSHTFSSFHQERDAILNWVQSCKLKAQSDPHYSYCILGRTHKLMTDFKELGLVCKSLHESKGREFREVWILGCEEGILPHVLSQDSIEEERRLLYVGITRAELVTHISMVHKRFGKSMYPSRFIPELTKFQQSIKIKIDDHEF